MNRPYKDVKEFLEETLLHIGSVVCCKDKTDDSVKFVLFAGYSVMSNTICLGADWITLDNLFEQFFISLDNGETFRVAGKVLPDEVVRFKVGSTYRAGANTFKVTARYQDGYKSWLVLDNQEVREIFVGEDMIETVKCGHLELYLHATLICEE